MSNSSKKQKRPDKHFVIGQLEGIIRAAKIIKPEMVGALEMLNANLRLLLKLPGKEAADE